MIRICARCNTEILDSELYSENYVDESSEIIHKHDQLIKCWIKKWTKKN